MSQRRTLRRETGGKKSAETGGKSALLGLLLDPDDGGDIFFRKVRLPPNQGALLLATGAWAPNPT
jgi:hypothetical protein